MEATTCITVAQRSGDYFWAEMITLNELRQTN